MASFFAIGYAGISANRSRYNYITGLWNLSYRVFSRFGGESIIDFLWSPLSLHKPVFIEVGTGEHAESNTRFLYQLRTTRDINYRLWSRSCRKPHNLSGPFFWKEDVISRSAFVSLVNACLLLHGFDVANILSLDVDGNNYWMLDLPLPYLRPKFLIVEFNAFFGGKVTVSFPYAPSFIRDCCHYSFSLLSFP